VKEDRKIDDVKRSDSGVQNIGFWKCCTVQKFCATVCLLGSISDCTFTVVPRSYLTC